MTLVAELDSHTDLYIIRKSAVERLGYHSLHLLQTSTVRLFKGSQTFLKGEIDVPVTIEDASGSRVSTVLPLVIMNDALVDIILRLPWLKIAKSDVDYSIGDVKFSTAYYSKQPALSLYRKRVAMIRLAIIVVLAVDKQAKGLGQSADTT